MFTDIIKYRSAYFAAILLLLYIGSSTPAFAQATPAAEEATATDTTEAAEEEPGKISSRLSLITTQMPGDTVELKAQLKAKVNKSWVTLKGFEVEFFAIGDEDETPLGKANTDLGGYASILTHVKNIPLNAEGYLSFAARYAGNEQLEETDADVSIRKAILTATPVKEDSTYTINVKVVVPTAKGENPVAEVDVVLFVKRMVGNLKVGEGTTDENGEIAIEFPLDLPGDDKGNLHITAFIEDYEEYGNLAATTVQPWGKPVSYEAGKLPRNLWSPHPPSWMVLTFLILMIAVWGHYAVIIYKLRQIKKAGT